VRQSSVRDEWALPFPRTGRRLRRQAGRCKEGELSASRKDAHSRRRKRPDLEVPDFGGRRIVIVVRAVVVGHGRVHELIDIDLVEAIDAHGTKLSAEPGILSPREGANPAMFAEEMMNAVGLVVDQVSLTGKKAEVVRHHDGAP
jgi:hypothetical protein